MTGLPDSVPVDGSTIISHVPFTAHHHRAYRSVHGGSIILSARTCTPRIYHNIHGVQVFHLLWCNVIFHSLQQPSSLFVCFRFYTLSIRAYRASSSSSPLFSVISIVSKCTPVFFCVTIHSNPVFRSSSPQFHNIQAILA